MVYEHRFSFVLRHFGYLAVGLREFWTTSAAKLQLKRRITLLIVNFVQKKYHAECFSEPNANEYFPFLQSP
jgi:hypothetical protein